MFRFIILLQVKALSQHFFPTGYSSIGKDIMVDMLIRGSPIFFRKSKSSQGQYVSYAKGGPNRGTPSKIGQKPVHKPRLHWFQLS